MDPYEVHCFFFHKLCDLRAYCLRTYSPILGPENHVGLERINVRLPPPLAVDPPFVVKGPELGGSPGPKPKVDILNIQVDVGKVRDGV